MPDWDSWVAERSYLSAKLKGAEAGNAEAYFLKLHATTEAYFRRILFVGLRLKMVSFGEAKDWLHHNDCTPSKRDFPKAFNCLYGPSLVFEMVLASSPRRQTLWELWLDFAKPVRNHLAHGVRAYGLEWLECCARINQLLLIELDIAMAEHLGGSIANDLTKLRPRLPTGKKGVNVAAIFGVKRGRQQRPPVSLLDAQNRLISSGLLLPT